jgi:hypothetical protein
MQSLKRFVFVLGLAAFCSVAPAAAGDLGIFGSYWDTDELGETAGGGIRWAFGDGVFRFELRGAYFPDLSEDFDQLIEDNDLETGTFEVEAIVPEAGFTFNLAPESRFQPYLGAGGSYYLLDTNVFELDDEYGYYGLFGFQVGGGGDGPAFFAEGLYRWVDGTVEGGDLIEDDFEIDLEGYAINAGVLFRF